MRFQAHNLKVADHGADVVSGASFHQLYPLFGNDFK